MSKVIAGCTYEFDATTRARLNTFTIPKRIEASRWRRRNAESAEELAEKETTWIEIEEANDEF